jgi:hypothetical protein
VKLKIIPIKIIFVVIIIFFLQITAAAQLRISAGGFVGGGFVKGNSPSVGSANVSFFIETNTVLFAEVVPRLGVIFAKDFNSIVPNVEKPYFPYVQGINFRGVTTQYFDNHIFLEEGIGLLALNDRTFSDTDIWDYGIVLSISGGWDLRGFELSGFKLGAGIEYGITFLNTLPQYTSLHLFFHYTL